MGVLGFEGGAGGGMMEDQGSRGIRAGWGWQLKIVLNSSCIVIAKLASVWGMSISGRILR